MALMYVRSVVVLGSLVCAAVLASTGACGGVTAQTEDGGASADATSGFDAAADGFDAGGFGCVGDCDAGGFGCVGDCDAGTRPYAVCPPSPPTPGSPCNVPGYETCEYGSSWFLACNLVMTCAQGQWQVQNQFVACAEPDAGPPCPATWAEAQAVVADAGLTNCQFVSCVYAEGWCGCGIGCGGSGGAPAPHDRLSGFFTCIPSQPWCAGPRPLGGTACEIDGGYCSYGFACGCGQDLHCAGGVWQVNQSPACP
jgi:hypothetical protein